jgi:hypothetical protein
LLISDIYDREGGDGIASKQGWTKQLDAAGFSLVCFEDQTYTLKEFAARVIWVGGCVGQLKECLRENAVKEAGYCLMIAQRY